MIFIFKTGHMTSTRIKCGSTLLDLYNDPQQMQGLTYLTWPNLYKLKSGQVYYFMQ